MGSIVLTGATGNLGSAVLKHLLNLVPPFRVVISLHNPSGDKAAALAQTGVTIRRGDYVDPDSLDSAFAGADTLFLVSSPSFDDSLRIRSHRNAIEAAQRQGIRRIVYTSFAFGDKSTAAVMRAHLATEAMLKESGLNYTIIREGIYMEVYPLFLGFYGKGKRDIYVSGDGPISWAALDNLAEATAKVIAIDNNAKDNNYSRFDNRTITLTGPQAFTLKETAAIISSILKKEKKKEEEEEEEGEGVVLHVVSKKEYEEHHAGQGEWVKAWESTYPWLETGAVGVVDPLLGQLVGRPLVGFEERLRELLLGEQTPADNGLHL